jgi:hypothetical protein
LYFSVTAVVYIFSLRPGGCAQTFYSVAAGWAALAKPNEKLSGNALGFTWFSPTYLLILQVPADLAGWAELAKPNERETDFPETFGLHSVQSRLRLLQSGTNRMISRITARGLHPGYVVSITWRRCTSRCG